MTNFERFRECYLRHLQAMLLKYPERYRYGPGQAAIFVDKVLAQQGAVKSDAFKAAAKECGFKPNDKGFQAFLDAQPKVVPEDGKSTNEERAAA